MPGRSFKSIYYHLVFHTKCNESYLEDLKLRKQVYHFIRNKCKRYHLFLHEIGGIENHVHLLIYIPPKIAVSQAVKLIKGSSSYFVNKELMGENILYWQEGYGILTVSKDRVNFIRKYIQNQEEHHKTKTTVKEFEEIEDDRKTINI